MISNNYLYWRSYRNSLKNNLSSYWRQFLYLIYLVEKNLQNILSFVAKRTLSVFATGMPFDFWLASSPPISFLVSRQCSLTLSFKARWDTIVVVEAPVVYYEGSGTLRNAVSVTDTRNRVVSIFTTYCFMNFRAGSS